MDRSSRLPVVFRSSLKSEIAFANPFISSEPLGYRSGSFNLNAYVGDDPVNYTDTDGLQAVAVQPPANAQPALAPVTIYVDLTVPFNKGRPKSLTPQTLPLIETEMNNALAKAGINLKAKLVGTAPPPGTNLGFQ